MYLNEKMRTVETILGIEEGGTGENYRELMN
jgi:hypothetical protein